MNVIVIGPADGTNKSNNEYQILQLSFFAKINLMDAMWALSNKIFVVKFTLILFPLLSFLASGKSL